MATDNDGVTDARHKASESSTLGDGHRQPHDPEKQALSARKASTADEMAARFGKEDPFGDESDSEVKYKTMKWWQASMSPLWPP